MFAAEGDAVAAFRNVGAGVGDRYRQFLHGLGRLHTHDEHTNVLQRSPSIRYRIGKHSPNVSTCTAYGYALRVIKSAPFYFGSSVVKCFDQTCL